ncbi:MAG TPA: hypothetical protein VFN67_29475 [Polyangiales bacterium]|nr:hypothetical protein [Polyangiales bacterium]
MEDNDKRNSSVPSVSSGDSPDSKSDMFDQHEATLPRFTIDPADAAPRQRTRTLLGVPSLVSDEPTRAPAPPSPYTSERAETTLAGGSLTSAMEEADTALQAKILEPSNELDMTIDVVEDELNDVTMVSDADVVALPDNTGQLQPVRFEAEPVITAAAKREVTATEPAYAATAPHPSSLSPREITRPAAGSQPEPHTSSRWGALLVAAVMLLATGAWFLTAGTFRRATLSNAESTTAAATQPAADKTENVAPAAQPPSEAPAAAAEAVAAAAAHENQAPTGAAPSTDDTAAHGTGLKNKPALTATMRGERVRRGAKGKAAPAPAPTGESPQGPTRSEVISRLESVRPAVNACAAGRSGVADLDITIAHTGVVMHVLVGGDFAGTAEGSCIARAVRGARFQSFKQERFRLLYPYAI